MQPYLALETPKEDDDVPHPGGHVLHGGSAGRIDVAGEPRVSVCQSHRYHDNGKLRLWSPAKNGALHGEGVLFDDKHGKENVHIPPDALEIR